MRMAVLCTLLLLFGCIDLGGEENVTEENVTNLTNYTPKQNLWERYNATEFSFEYPSNMDVVKSEDTFNGTHSLNGETGEMMVVYYYNTVDTYGPNKDKVMQKNPSVAASDLLSDDLEDDPTLLLDNAEELSNISAYSLSRDTMVAEISFKLRLSNSSPKYDGYALSLYVPERSLHTKVRIIAKDPARSKKIRDNFLLSFRIE
jgi:hypothetical protein